MLVVVVVAKFAPTFADNGRAALRGVSTPANEPAAPRDCETVDDDDIVGERRRRTTSMGDSSGVRKPGDCRTEPPVGTRNGASMAPAFAVVVFVVAAAADVVDAVAAVVARTRSGVG